MDEMKFDMCGSATVMGVLQAVSTYLGVQFTKKESARCETTIDSARGVTHLTEMEAYFLDTRLCESVIFLNTVEHFAETPVTIRFSIVELLGC